MPTGHSAEQAPVLVQAPKPSASICATIFSARNLRSAFPCGSSAYLLTCAPTKSIADAFLQAATQAPQAIQAAELNASSAIGLGIRVSLASRALPVFTEI